MSGGRAGKRAPPTAKATPSSPGPKKKSKQSEVETAASDAAKEIADLADATEATTKQGLPTGLLERRIERLQKEKAEMEKRMADLLDADRKRKEEEAKAAKFSRIVESASPGAVVQVQVSRQVHSFIFVCNILFRDL